jgi:hypothetical protein
VAEGSVVDDGMRIPESGPARRADSVVLALSPLA